MKLTTAKLRQIIKEELENVLEGGSKKGWKPTMSKEETEENIWYAYSGENVGLGSNDEKQFISWLTRNKDLGSEGDAQFSVQELANDYRDHLYDIAKRKGKNVDYDGMYEPVFDMLYRFGRGSDYGSHNEGTIYYDDVTYNAVRYGLDMPNEKMRAARATNKEPEFQTNPELEESRKRRTKRK